MSRSAIPLALLLVLAGCSGASKEERAAIAGCKDFLLAAAKNPSSAVIPKPGKHAVGARTQILEWDRGGGLLFMNNMGVKLDTEAVCVTNESGIMVEELYVDGKKMFESLEFRKIMHGDTARE